MSFAYSYAHALKDSFKDTSLPAHPQLDFFTAVKDLNKLDKAFQEPSINMFFLSPAISLEVKKQVLGKVFKSLNQTGFICSFVYLLLDKKKWGQWPAILKHLNNIKEASQGFVLAEVESAFPLSEELKEKLSQKLTLFLRKKPRFQEILNPHLIGGVKIRAGGFVFDDSLSYHLNQLENQAQRT